MSKFDIGDLVYWTEIIFGLNGHENRKYHGTIIDILRIPEGTRFVIMVKIMPFGGKRPMNVLVHQLRKMESED
mgnify:FL=1